MTASRAGLQTSSFSGPNALLGCIGYLIWEKDSAGPPWEAFQHHETDIHCDCLMIDPESPDGPAQSLLESCWSGLLSGYCLLNCQRILAQLDVVEA